jgi:hypothetical protein
MLFSLQSILSFIQFLVLAVAVTGSAILFAFFYWEGGKENLSDEYKSFVKRISLTMTLTSLILLPALLFVNNLLWLLGKIHYFYI